MTDWVVDWMTGRGHPGYRNRITALEAKLAAATSEAERQRLTDEIEQVKMEAHDRYDDWRTDPLP